MKRLLDLFLSIFLLILFLPVFCLLSLAVWVNDRGPVFFYQKRIGLKGREFEIIKFRTMIVDAESKGTGLFSYDGDNRVTRVGAFLRKTSLDELPQLLNVIRGDMAIVGPRPPVTYELGPWNEYTPVMLQRFDVLPGITGLAQISGRNDLDWDGKVENDNKYVYLFKKYGVLLDVYIIFKTVWVIAAAQDTIEVYTGLQEGPITKRARDATK